MLTIRNAQMAVFRVQRLEEYAARLVEHLLGELPGASQAAGGEDGVRALVRAVLGRAPALGIASAGGVTTLAELWLQYGDGFQRSGLRPWILKMLSNPELPGDLKIEAIRARLDEDAGGRTLVPY